MIGNVRVTSYYETKCDACATRLRSTPASGHYLDAEAEWKAEGWRRVDRFGWLCPACVRGRPAADATAGDDGRSTP